MGDWLSNLTDLAGLGVDVYASTQAPPGYHYDPGTGRYISNTATSTSSLMMLVVIGLVVWLLVKKG